MRLQLHEAEKKLDDTQNKLARHRSQHTTKASTVLSNGRKEVANERSKSPITFGRSSEKQSQCQDDVKPSGDNLNSTRRPSSPLQRNGGSAPDQAQSRPQILIPSMAPNISYHIKMKESANKYTSGSGSLPPLSIPAFDSTPAKTKGDKASKISSEHESAMPNRTKRKLGLSFLLHPLAFFNS